MTTTHDSEQSEAEIDSPEGRVIGKKLSAQHVLKHGTEIEPGVYRVEYSDGSTITAEFGYATITQVDQ